MSLHPAAIELEDDDGTVSLVPHSMLLEHPTKVRRTEGSRGPVRCTGMAEEETTGYAESLRELEEILAGIEADDVDIDVLAAKVSRAAELLEVCRDRIDGARLQVERVVDSLDSAD